MSLRPELGRLFIGADPALRRLLGYWAATAVFYTVSICILWLFVRNGIVERAAGERTIVFSLCWLFGCYGLIRASKVLRIMPSHLAVLQSLVALAFNVAIYSFAGPIRGASLMVLPVVIVFCTFSLRPRETLVLCAFAICALAGTMA
jgi:hypothetical protein